MGREEQQSSPRDHFARGVKRKVRRLGLFLGQLSPCPAPQKQKDEHGPGTGRRGLAGIWSVCSALGLLCPLVKCLGSRACEKSEHRPSVVWDAISP